MQHFSRLINGIGFTSVSELDVLASTAKLSFPSGALLSVNDSFYGQSGFMLRFLFLPMETMRMSRYMRYPAILTVSVPKIQGDLSLQNERVQPSRVLV